MTGNKSQTTEEMKEAERLACVVERTTISHAEIVQHIYESLLSKGENAERSITAAEARGRRIGLEEAAKFVENKYVPYGPYKPVSDRTRKRIPETAQLIANAIRALIQKGE